MCNKNHNYFKIAILRISNEYISVTAMKQPNQTITSEKAGLPNKSSASMIRSFSWNQTSISYLNSSIKLILTSSIWNLGSDAYFEYTSCYFKVVTLFVRNSFRVRLPYLLLIRGRNHNLTVLLSKYYLLELLSPAVVISSSSRVSISYKKIGHSCIFA
jgi:hypothetical protein